MAAAAAFSVMVVAVAGRTVNVLKSGGVLNEGLSDSVLTLL